MATKDAHLDDLPKKRDWTSLDDEAVDYGDVQGTCLRPANKPIPRLHVVDKTGKIVSFQNIHLDSAAEFDGNSFVLVFAATKLWEIRVVGRNLWRVFDYCSLHRWPFLRADHRAQFKDGEAIESITIRDITPKGEPHPALS